MTIINAKAFALQFAVLAFAGAALLNSGVATAQALEESWRAALDGDLVTVQRLVERGASPDCATLHTW